jgi:hypothetical protein
MNNKTFVITTLVVAVTFGVALPAQAEIKLDEASKLSLYGDFRGRLEADWDSKRSDGTDRDDRNRLRIRFRAGLEYKANDKISFGFRVRSGSDDSQQSPHITIVDFDDNDTGDANFNFDKWYFEYKFGRSSVWLGRNSLQFWKPDDLMLDDDITPAGLAYSYAGDRVSFHTGYFSNPVGMKNFTGNTGVAQVVLKTAMGDTKFVFAGGVAAIDADAANPNNRLLLDGNGARDYTIWVANVEASLTTFNHPLKLNLDLYHNSENYSASDPDPFTAFHRDETDGYVVSARLGDTKDRGDWLFGYFYSHIESLAINNSLAQDDWVRWGSATQTRASNFEGSEFRAAVGLGNNMNVVARLYVVEGIKLRAVSSLDKEDGNRFRIDLNFRF